MRILQILPELNVGGVETGTVDFAKYLVRNGHHAVIVSNGGSLVEDVGKAGVRHYSLPVHKKSLWTIVPCVRRLRKIIQDENIEIVHARSRVPAWIAFFACQRTDAQFITTCHGHYSQNFFSRVMGFGKLVIVPSAMIGRHMMDDFKVAPENIRVVPRGVDLERFAGRKEGELGKSTYVISMVGRITPLKGHIYFLKAMAQVVRSMPFVRIQIIGDVPPKRESYKKELEILVRRLGLTENVQFLGTRFDVPQLLSQTDVLVLASTEPESFGRVIIEAQAVGVPVVATRVGGVLEIIDDEKTGLLVLPKDTDGMAQAVLRLLNDRKFARQVAAAASEKVHKEFTLEQMAGRTLGIYHELLDSFNILVIKMSSLGDVILVTPSLRALRKKFPQAKIHCLVGKESAPVLARCPYIDELVIIDPKSSEKGFWRLLKFSQKLRKQRFDKVIDFQNNFKSHLLSFLSLGKESYGYKRGKLDFLLTHPVILPKGDLAPVEHQFQILQRLGIPYKKDSYLELWPTENDKRNVQRLLESEWVAEGQVVVGVNLAASGKWPTKNWPLEYVAKLCDLLALQNIRVVLTGTEKDREAARRVTSLAKTKPAVMVGKTSVMELAALIRRCHVYITPDSATLHVAAAMKTPLIAFFGPTSSARHLPPAKSALVLERSMPCAPCYSGTCRVRTHACMRQIMPEEVAAKIKQLLEQEKKADTAPQAPPLAVPKEGGDARR